MAIVQKKKVCKGCGEETYIFSKGLCKVCSMRSKALLSKSGSLSQLNGDRSKCGVRNKLRIDFNAPLDVLETYSLSFLKRVCDFDTFYRLTQIILETFLFQQFRIRA